MDQECQEINTNKLKKKVNMRNYKILMVDDEPTVIEAYLDVLARVEDVGIKELRGLASVLFEEKDEQAIKKPTLKLTIDTAHQGEEAIEFAEKALKINDPYLVAVLDMRMPPGINGFETAQKLIELDPNIEICFITAYSDTPFEEIAEKLGNGRFLLLRKPVNHQELVTTIEFLGEHGYKCHKKDQFKHVH